MNLILHFELANPMDRDTEMFKYEDKETKWHRSAFDFNSQPSNQLGEISHGDLTDTLPWLHLSSHFRSNSCRSKQCI